MHIRLGAHLSASSLPFHLEFSIGCDSSLGILGLAINDVLVSNSVLEGSPPKLRPTATKPVLAVFMIMKQ